MIFRTIISLGLLCAALAIIAYKSGLNALLASADKLSLTTVAIVVLFLFAGTLLAALRLKFVAGDLGYRLTFREALAAMSIGQLAGSVFFQIAGQLIGRSWFLARRNMPAAATVLMTGYERLAALAVSLVFAAAGAFYLFGKVTVNLDAGGADLLRLLAGLALAVAAGAAFAWGRKAAGKVSLDSQIVLVVVRSVAVSAVIQLTTMAAYLVAARNFAPAIALSDLAAAIAVVMLSASLPISLGGWGLREVSAIVVLGMIGLSSSDAFTVALLIGVVSIALVAGLVLTASDVWKKAETTLQPSPIDYNQVLAWALPIMAATGVLFQVYVPFGNGGLLNVNLADPIAILGGVLFVLAAWRRGRLPVWRFERVNLAVAAATFVIVAGLLIGAARFGFTPWAMTNRFTGWFILLSFAATGALLVRTAGTEGFRVLLTTFVVAAAAIVLLEAALETIQNAGVEISGLRPVYVREGFAQNRNAFAFQLLMAAAAATAGISGKLRIGALSVIMLGLWLAGSRAGWGAVAVMMLFAIAIRALPWRDLAAALFLAACLIGLTLLPLLVPLVTSGFEVIASLFSEDGAAKSFIRKSRISPFIRIAMPEDFSIAERLYSIKTGWRMFVEHPLVGAGLGAFMQSELASAGRPLVIHSTPLWLLAELGLAGFVVFFLPACAIFLREIKSPARDAASVFILMAFAGFGTMALVHDMLYQRSLWLLFGAALALIPSAHAAVRSAQAARERAHAA